MKNQILFFTLSLVLFSCNEKTSKPKEVDTNTNSISAENIYPEALIQVFEAHGGLKSWKKQRTLTYTIPKPDNPEIHYTDLLSRKDKIETPSYEMGFDGEGPWLLNKTKPYEGNVEFYHNLMFYFYAMPFVLADDGIQYSETESLHFEGMDYPGIQITYNAGVGTSPKDEYYIHYHPDTFEMVWLGYTVTYRTGEDSDNIKWIRYNDWGMFNGIKLPNSISWYSYEGRTIKELRNTVPFENVKLSEIKKPFSFYKKPEQAVYYIREKKM